MLTAIDLGGERCSSGAWIQWLPAPPSTMDDAGCLGSDRPTQSLSTITVPNDMNCLPYSYTVHASRGVHQVQTAIPFCSRVYLECSFWGSGSPNVGVQVEERPGSMCNSHYQGTVHVARGWRPIHERCISHHPTKAGCFVTVARDLDWAPVLTCIPRPVNCVESENVISEPGCKKAYVD